MNTYSELREHISHGRSGLDRPLENNTRAVVRDFGETQSVAVRLHGTDIVTLYPDGNKVLNTGGWETNTTFQRINSYGSRHIRREGCERDGTGGDWFVQARPLDSDPRPTWPRRSVPRPYGATNPGPEPVDDGVGCIAGLVETWECIEHVHIYDWERARSGEFVTSRVDYTTTDEHGVVTERFRPVAHRASMATLTWGEKSYDYGHRGQYKQCPHCKAFQARHERWDMLMNGGWRAPNDGAGGHRCYTAMVANLERYGSREAWQEAYIGDLRAVRALRVEFKEWERRNWVPWDLGSHVDSDGYALAGRAWRKHVKEQIAAEKRAAVIHARIEKRAKKIRARKAVQAKRDAKLRAEIAKNLAAAAANELEFQRTLTPEIYLNRNSNTRGA